MALKPDTVVYRVCPRCHSQRINSLAKRERSLYCAALAEFKSLGSSVLPEVVEAREKAAV